MGGRLVPVGPLWVSLSHKGCIWMYTNGIQAFLRIVSRLEFVFGQNSLSLEEAMVEWHDNLELKVRMLDA